MVHNIIPSIWLLIWEINLTEKCFNHFFKYQNKCLLRLVLLIEVDRTIFPLNYLNWGNVKVNSVSEEEVGTTTASDNDNGREQRYKNGSIQQPPWMTIPPLASHNHRLPVVFLVCAKQLLLRHRQLSRLFCSHRSDRSRLKWKSIEREPTFFGL